MHHTWSAEVPAVAACSVNAYLMLSWPNGLICASAPVQSGHIPSLSRQSRMFSVPDSDQCSRNTGPFRFVVHANPKREAGVTCRRHLEMTR